MLVRAARRKCRSSTQIPRGPLSTDFYVLWQCPALRNEKVQSRWNSGDANQHGLGFRKRRNSRDGICGNPRRSLATQMSGEMRDPDVRWDFEINPKIAHPLQSPSAPQRLDVTALLALRPANIEDTVRASDSLAVPPTRYRTTIGTSGSISDMYAVLQGCFCVGQLKRAEAIIKRLTKLNISGEHLMDIHTEFVRVSVERIVSNPRDSETQALHKWFELEIRGKLGFVDCDVLLYMLKASLRESSEKKRDRLVKRYMDLLPPGTSIEERNKYGLLTEEELELIQIISNGGKTKVKLDDTYEQKEEVKQFSIAEEEVPEITPANQKGLGLSSLKQSLSILSDKPPGFDPSLLTYEQQRERQKRIEENTVLSAVTRWRDENSKLTKMGMDTAIQTKNIGARMWKWQLALEEYIRSEIQKLEALEESGAHLEGTMSGSNLTIWLRFLKAEHMAAITILTTMSKLGILGIDKGVTLSTIIMHVGIAVEKESMAMHITKAAKRNFKRGYKRKEKFLIELIKRKSRRSLSSTAKSVETPDPDLDQPFPDIRNNPWPMDVLAKVGAFLITGLIKTATIPVSRVNPSTEELITQVQPAFFHAQQYKTGKRVGLLMTNSSLVEQLKREPVHSLLATHLPMIIEPAPWTSFNSGGFLASPVKVLRIKQNDKDQRHYAEAAIARGDMEQIFKGLDVLGKTSWRINNPVLDTMIKAWNSGEAFKKIPPANPKLHTPPKPAADADPLDRKEYIKAVKLVENQRGGIHSQRCFQNFQIEIARALRDEVFYFPHNMDFRGRVYPIPPLLNHMGADHCRGLLKFGEARELGVSGLRWLKIHLANVYGFDKASLSERERFAEEHLDDIYDSATNPLEGKRWWLKAEDAWQTLATCIELKNALDSPEPTKYMSSLPVHQDGTCNGLQHYAALGGDEWGARQVNLEPGDRPSDIYTGVADMVKDEIAKDLAAGDPCAKVLQGKINRKVVKQTVMTNVYGVTYIGAKAQVRKQLVAAYRDLPNHPDFNAGTLAGYVATKIFKALSTMFSGAHGIQHWLGDCANRISTALTPEQIERVIEVHQETSSGTKGEKFDITILERLLQFKSSVIWTTPLHMPVVQPYRVTKSRVVRTCLQRLSLSEPHRSDPVSKRKQLQAFPPNFVHSLDATHMMLSALKCYDAGLTFAAVHDSFWAHAADVDKMNGVLRDAFIQIHSEDIIGRLAAEFEVRYRGCFRLVKIKAGSPAVAKLTALRKSKAYLDLKAELLGDDSCSKISQRKAIFTRQVDELIMEKRVADMLRSDDPEVVAKAQKMWPASRVFSDMAADEEIEVPKELTEIGVGDMPTREAMQKADNALDEVDMESMGSDNAIEFDDVSDESIDNDNSDEIIEDPAESTSADKADDNLDSLTAEDLEKAAQYYKKSQFQKSHFARRASGASKTNSTYGQATTVWLPLKFPPVPKRGNFDVSRLKESKYFFS